MENKNTAKRVEEENEEESEDNESQLPILNSFYIRDIERAINAISSGRASKPLQNYLKQSSDKQVDLYTNEAIPLIHDHLTPTNRQKVAG